MSFNAAEDTTNILHMLPINQGTFIAEILMCIALVVLMLTLRRTSLYVTFTVLCGRYRHSVPSDSMNYKHTEWITHLHNQMCSQNNQNISIQNYRLLPVYILSTVEVTGDVHLIHIIDNPYLRVCLGGIKNKAYNPDLPISTRDPI